MNNQSNIREIFDNISLRVISFLEDLARVTDIEFSERHGVAEVTLGKWEEENAPYRLPDDYRAFLQISDGLLLQWKIIKNNNAYPLGSMHLNKLRDIQKVECRHYKLCTVGEDEPSTDEEELKSPSSDDEPHLEESTKKESRPQKDLIAAFDIDSLAQDGRVALLYRNTFNKPQIWFQDLSCSWFFIANTFTDYFRLMIMHLGIPHWQYVFTNVGMDPVSMQWFRYLSPDRLAIDIENRNKKAKKKKYKQDKMQELGARKNRRAKKAKLKGAGTHNFEKFSNTGNNKVKIPGQAVNCLYIQENKCSQEA